MSIDRDIHDLLYTHDCVIVPDFGGFLTHYRPARLDEQRRLVHPPAKDLSFNRHLVRQDGLLSDRLAKREGLDFRVAIKAVDDDVAAWKTKLERTGRLEVGRIGTFFHDAENNLQFEPDKRVNYLKDAYGLRPVAAVPLAKPEPVPVRRIMPMPSHKGRHLATGASRTPAFLVAASATAILLTAATWWAIGSTGPQGKAWGGFDLTGSSETRRYTLPTAPPHMEPNARKQPWVAPAGQYGVKELPIAGPSAPLVAVDLGQAPMQAEPESTAVATRSVAARFHVIGGCFLEKENADRFIAELQAKGFAATLIDVKGGLYRVAFGSYPLRSTAMEALSAVRKEEAPSAWLLVK